MSGIYIPGMEIPTGCDTCPFEHFGDCYGGKAKRIMDIDEEMALGVRHTYCPLIPVPDHGQLMDIDAPYELRIKLHGDKSSIDLYGRVIIPAEEGE